MTYTLVAYQRGDGEYCSDFALQRGLSREDVVAKMATFRCAHNEIDKLNGVPGWELYVQVDGHDDEMDIATIIAAAEVRAMKTQLEQRAVREQESRNWVAETKRLEEEAARQQYEILKARFEPVVQEEPAQE